jgi:hypothetical protein
MTRLSNSRLVPAQITVESIYAAADRDEINKPDLLLACSHPDLPCIDNLSPAALTRMCEPDFLPLVNF